MGYVSTFPASILSTAPFNLITLKMAAAQGTASVTVKGYKATDGPASPSFSQDFSLTTALSSPTFDWEDIIKITIQATIPGDYPVRPHALHSLFRQHFTTSLSSCPSCTRACTPPSPNLRTHISI